MDEVVLGSNYLLLIRKKILAYSSSATGAAKLEEISSAYVEVRTDHHIISKHSNIFSVPRYLKTISKRLCSKAVKILRVQKFCRSVKSSYQDRWSRQKLLSQVL
jgi:hypothetical protein